MIEKGFTLTQGIALTGSIGVGKSTVVSCLKDRGWKVIESDRLARELVMPGQPANRQIKAVFGEDVFGPGDELDRGKLSALIFSNEEKRRRLEKILHPKIRARWISEASEAQKRGDWVAVEIPLLYEVGAGKYFKHVVVVACSASNQRKRLLKRPWNNKEMEQRLNAQLPQAEKIDRADFVIWNDFKKQDIEEQLDQILKTIQQS